MRLYFRSPYPRKTACLAFFVTSLVLNPVHAEINKEILRKFGALKSIALSAEVITPEQVGNALAVALEKNCSDIDDATQGKYTICGYAPSAGMKDDDQLAFIHYITVIRPGQQNPGGALEFIAKNGPACIRQDDLVKFFNITPGASTKALTEPSTPYVPERRYQLVFPKQGIFDVALNIFQTGDCVSTLTLSKSAYQSHTTRK